LTDLIPIRKAGPRCGGSPVFTFTLTLQEFVYALTFVSSSDQKTITLGVTTDLVRGDVFFRGELMAGALIAAVPVAILYNLFLDREKLLRQDKLSDPKEIKECQDNLDAALTKADLDAATIRRKS
jgi:hypothetical protein